MGVAGVGVANSQALGPVQGEPAEPAVAVEGAGDVEGAVGDAEEPVGRAVREVEPAEVGRRVLPAELWRSQTLVKSPPVPPWRPQVSPGRTHRWR